MGFFEWVAKTRRITDNPRGDFVQDCKFMWEHYQDEGVIDSLFQGRACWEARQEADKLRRLYKISMP